MNTDEQAVLQIINTYATENTSWMISIKSLCELTSLPEAELTQTLKMLEREGYISVYPEQTNLQITITHTGYEAALDAPQF